MPTDAGSIYSEIRIQLDKLKGDVVKAEAQYDKLSKGVTKETDEMEQKATKSFSQINLAGVAAFAGIGFAVKNAIGQFTSFTTGLSNVQSVAGATVSELAALEAAALEAGETTAFSATEATDALYNLASAGLDASESTAALDGVLQLAGATQSDLAVSSATVTAALSQYSLDAEQATDVSNIFAAAIANSQANMTKLSTAFRQVGPVAGTLGKSLEDTTGALQALFDAGLRGEQAGTVLRNVYSRLADETSTTIDALTSLGVAFDDVNPEVNSTAEIIGALNEAGLTTGETIAAFGQEAGPGLLALLNVGQQGLEDYTEAVTGTQAAAEAYQTQLDNLGGDIAIFKSTLEALAISFSKEFEPALRGTVQFLTDLLRVVNNLPGPVKVFLGVIVAAIPVIGGLTVAVSALGGALTVLTGPVGLVVAGITALVAGVTAIGTGIKNARLEEVSQEFGELSEQIGISNDRLLDLVDTSKKLGADAPEDIEAVILKMKEFQDETGISDDALDELIQNAERLGATDENIDGVVRTLFDLQENAGLTASAIEMISGAILRAETTAQDLNTTINDLATGAELTREQVLQIADASENLSEEWQSQVAKLLEQERALRENRTIVNQLRDVENIRLTQAERRAAEEQAAADALADQLAEQERIAALNLSTQQQIDQAVNDLLLQEALVTEGLRTQQEAAEAQVSTREALIENLIRARIEQDGLTAAQEEELEKQQASLVYWRNIVTEMANANDEGEELADTTSDIADGVADISSQTEDYEMQLLRLVGTKYEILEAERRRAIAAAEASGASEEAIEGQIKAINRLYTQLFLNVREGWEDSGEEAESVFDNIVDSAQTAVDTLLPMWQDFYSAFSALSDASAQKQLDNVDTELAATLASLDTQLAARLAAAGLTEQTEIERLQTQLAAAQQAGDAETAADLQDEIERLRIKQEFEQQATEAEAAAAKEREQIEYEAALNSYRLNMANAIANAAASIIKIWSIHGANPILAGVLTAASAVTTGAEIATIEANKPEPPKMATGGVIKGSSSGTIVRAAENKSDELMINRGPEGRPLLKAFAKELTEEQKNAANNVADIRTVKVEIEAPEIKIEALEITAPKIAAPEITAPKIAAPEITAPKIAAPEITMPGIEAPEITAPDIDYGGIIIPEAGVNKITNISNNVAKNISTGGIVIPDRSEESSTQKVALEQAGAGQQQVLNREVVSLLEQISEAVKTGKPITIENKTILDGRPIAENSATYYNNGQVRLNK